MSGTRVEGKQARQPELACSSASTPSARLSRGRGRRGCVDRPAFGVFIPTSPAMSFVHTLLVVQPHPCRCGRLRAALSPPD